MKYLLINSVAGIGSTGKIAADICRKLISEGHQAVLAYGREKANCDDIETVMNDFLKNYDKDVLLIDSFEGP